MIIGTKKKVKKSKHFKRGGGFRSFHKYYDFLNFCNKGKQMISLTRKHPEFDTKISHIYASLSTHKKKSLTVFHRNFEVAKVKTKIHS